jgi:hypothetical protein
MIYTIVRKDKSNNIDAVISFSSVSSMEESWSSTVTSQVVEYGFNVTDNINIEAPTYSIAAVLSGYSLFNTDKEIIWSGESFETNGNTDDKYSHIKARDELIKIFSDRRIVTLLESENNSGNTNLEQKEIELKSGKFKENDSCIITSLTINHPDEGQGAFLVNLSLQKIVTAKVMLAELEEGEKVALIKTLAITYEPTKSKKDETTGLTDLTTGEPSEETPTQESGNFKTQDAIRRLPLKASKEYNAKVEEARYMTEVTGKTHTVGKRGTSYIVVLGKSKLFLEGE